VTPPARPPVTASVGAPEDRLDPGNHFAGVERLGHVVVRTQAQCEQLVGVVDAGGEHEHGHVAVPVQLPEDLEAVETRQHEVEDHQVGSLLAGEGERLQAVTGGHDVQTVTLQVRAEDVHDARLIVDDKHQRHLLTVPEGMDQASVWTL
jgi:hypothetical protein